MRRARHGSQEALAAENAALRETLARVRTTLDALAAGDLEHRAPALPDVPGADTAGLRTALNRAVDVVDGFVREVGSALTAASEGRHERRLVLRGLPGAFRTSAQTIDAAQVSIAERDAQIARTLAERAELVADFERDVLGGTRQVRTTTDEMATQVGELATAVGTLERDTARGTRAVDRLTESSESIRDVVALITTVTAQTRLLALNATIEAARAGAAGRSFAVVADEVRRLADETARASASVGESLGASREAIGEVTAALAEIETSVEGMRAGTDLIGERATGADAGSLASAAARLDAHVDHFLGELRS